MLISLIFCIISTIILYAWGVAVLDFAYKKRAVNYSFFSIYFVGLCAACFIANGITIFFGTNSIIAIGILIAPLLYKRRLAFSIDSYSKILPHSTPLKILAMSLLLVGICMHAWMIKHPDTLSYQNALIKSAIMGAHPVGNITIKSQLGIGGAWFPLAALFSFDWLFGKTMTFINLSLISVSILFLICKVESSIKKKNLLSPITYLLIIVIGCYEYTFIRLAITSAAPDTPAAILGIASLLFFMGRGHQSWILTLFSITAVTLKISLFPILLLPAWHLMQYGKRADWIVSAVLVILVTTPFFTKNILSTGYAVYPISASIIIDEDYVPDKSKVQEEANYIKAYARNINTTRDPAHVNEISSQPVREWVPTWWNQLEGAGRAVIALFILGISGCILFLHRFTKPTQKLIPALITIVIGAVFWFSTAPAIRFGTAYLLAPLFVFADLCANRPSNPYKIKINFNLINGIILICSGIIAAYFIYRMTNYMDCGSIWLPKGPLS